jgi:tetratricopeptide (TPR) repeat protein
MKQRALYFFSALTFILVLHSCKTSEPVSSRYTGQDKQVFDLIDRLSRNPNDHEAEKLLPDIYQQALDSKRQLNQDVLSQMPPGDRYIEKAKQLEVLQKMYTDIKSSPGASRVVPNPWDPSVEIQINKNNAAREYYGQGMTYLNYNNRAYAGKAYDMFEKANRAVPGYENVIQMMEESKRLSIIHVVVRPVNYYNYNYSYWGFQNDFLQNQMVRDLNATSFRDARFYTEWDARNQRIQMDKVVDLNIVNMFIGQSYSQNNTYQRSAQIQKGTTKSIPAQPVYETVYATVYVTTRILESNAALECRIYDQATGANLFFDQFQGRYNWRVQSATFKGDRRALTSEDLRLISNSPNTSAPSRNEIASRLINDCYGQLINSIKNAVRFY